MSRADIANNLHGMKYNCCQSVVCAFAEEAGIDLVTAFKFGEGFGLGGGNMQGICGALAGALMMSGLKNSDGNVEAPGTKAATTALSKEIMELFAKKTGALTCRELKGIDTGKVLCACSDCIKAGVECVEEVLGY